MKFREYIFKPLWTFQTLLDFAGGYLGSLFFTAIINKERPISTIAENLIIAVVIAFTVRYVFYFKDRTEKERK
jgi:hypothetical protein